MMRAWIYGVNYGWIYGFTRQQSIHNARTDQHSIRLNPFFQKGMEYRVYVRAAVRARDAVRRRFGPRELALCT